MPCQLAKTIENLIVSTKTLTVCMLFCLCFVAGVEDVHADDGIWLGGYGANLNTLGDGGLWGPGTQLGLQYALTDFWGLFADVGGSYHFENVEDELPADAVMSASFGVQYIFDVFTYVPYLGVGATFHLDAPLIDDAAFQTNVGAKVTLGADYRYSRYWSFGFQGELHALATDFNRYPIYSLVGLRVMWHPRF